MAGSATTSYWWNCNSRAFDEFANFKGLDNVGLYYGAGTMKETQQMGKGNYALASHHVFGITGASNMLIFSPLDRAKAGMKILPNR